MYPETFFAFFSGVVITVLVGMVTLGEPAGGEPAAVGSDDVNYKYNLVMSQWRGGNIIAMSSYTSDQCEYAKKYAEQQDKGIRVACVPMAKPPAQPEAH